MPKLLNKILFVLAYLGLFIMALGLGFFLHYQHYAWWSFVVVYLTLLGSPFFHALPLSEEEFHDFDSFKAFAVGLVTVGVLGVFHLVYFFVNGDKESFFLIVPMIAFISFLQSSMMRGFKKIKL